MEELKEEIGKEEKSLMLFLITSLFQDTTPSTLIT
jgi:hypothetical protein